MYCYGVPQCKKTKQKAAQLPASSNTGIVHSTYPDTERELMLISGNDVNDVMVAGLS